MSSFSSPLSSLSTPQVVLPPKLTQLRQQNDLPYPQDWRRHPAEISTPKDTTHVFVKCKLTSNKLTLKEITQQGVKCIEQELASHGVLSVRASPLTRRQCREQLRSHIRYYVVFDFIAQKNFILTGIMHEAAEIVYKEVETNFPLTVTEVLIGITDETRTFSSAEALVSGGRTDHINNEHAFIVSPGGKGEAAQLRQRLEMAEQDKAFMAGMRIKRPNRKKTKYEAPPPPEWLVKVEEKKKKEKQLQEELDALNDGGKDRPFDLDRCGRCSRYDAFYNRATSSATASISMARKRTTSSANHHHHHHTNQANHQNRSTSRRSSSSVGTTTSSTRLQKVASSPLPRNPASSTTAPADESSHNNKKTATNDDKNIHDHEQKPKIVEDGMMKEEDDEKQQHHQQHQKPNQQTSTERKPSFRFPTEENNNNNNNNNPDGGDSLSNSTPQHHHQTSSSSFINNHQQQQDLALLLSPTRSGDPSILAMKTVLNMVSRRQNLRPMNMLTITPKKIVDEGED